MAGAPPASTDSARLPRQALIGCILVLVLHAALAWLIREPGITVRNDDALYLLLSRSLRHGHFLDQHLQGSPPHALYPPGFPALLAVLTLVGGERMDLYLSVNILLSVASLALVFDLAWRRFGVATAFLVLVPLATNDYLVRYAGSLISEPPYLFFSTLALWLFSRAELSSRVITLGLVATIVAGLTRSAGVALLAAITAWLLLERRFRTAIVVGLIGGLFIGGWLLRGFLLPDEFRTTGRSYAEDVERMVDRGGDYFLYKRFKIALIYLTVHLPATLPIPGIGESAAGARTWGIILGSLVPVGLLAWWLRRWRLGALYLVGYIGMLAVWRMSSPRFLTVVIPLIVLAAVVPLTLWVGGRWPKVGFGLAALLAALLTVQGLSLWRQDLADLAACDRSQPLHSEGCYNADARSFFRLSERARDAVPKDGVVLTAREATFAYYSHRTAWYLNTAFAPDSSHILEGLERRGIRYIVLGHTHTTEARTLAPALANECDRLGLLLEEPPRSYLFELRPTRDTADTRACRAIAAYRADSTPVPLQRK